MTRLKKIAAVLSAVVLGFAILAVIANFLGLLPPVHPIFIQLLYLKIAGAVGVGVLGIALYVRRRLRRLAAQQHRSGAPAPSLAEK